MKQEIMVAKTCIYCDEIYPTHYKKSIICEKCRKNSSRRRKVIDKRNITSWKDKYWIAKEYIMNETRNVIELGTEDTVYDWTQFPPDRLARNPDGTPNFRIERQIVSYLKRKTFGKSMKVKVNVK